MSLLPKLSVLSLPAFALMTAAASAATVPRPSPEFAITMPNGSQLLLSQYAGKVVLLEFLYTTWPHCQHTTQVLSGIQNEYGPRGVQILGIAFNEGAIGLVRPFIQQFRPTFPVGYSPRDSVFDYLQRLPSQPGYVPELVFIDRKRVIQGQFSGDGPMFQNQDKSIREELDKLLKQPAVSKKNGRPAHRKPS